jgi:signal transduction histidine kinase
MLAVVSHELKTPLTSIRMAMHLLLEERVGALTAKQSELLVAARDDSDRLNQIIENLMDMGRLESGRVMMDFQSVHPDELMNEAVQPFTTAFKDRGVELKVEAPPELPDVLADQTRIGHVFSNLLSNALKFTPPGGTVRLSGEALADAVQFSVSDTGSGIPKEFLPRVFERFFRVPGQSAGAGGGGAGLGLAIAQEIVAAHGGQISADSAEGAGSTFRFTLRRDDVVSSDGSNGRVSEVSHGS